MVRRERPPGLQPCTSAGLAAQRQEHTRRSSGAPRAQRRGLFPSLSPASPPSTRAVDNAFQQPLIKDLEGKGGGGRAPETNVPDALLLAALVFTESQAGIRFPPPPPSRRDKEPCAAAAESRVATRGRNRTRRKDFHGNLKTGGWGGGGVNLEVS